MVNQTSNLTRNKMDNYQTQYIGNINKILTEINEAQKKDKQKETVNNSFGQDVLPVYSGKRL